MRSVLRAILLTTILLVPLAASGQAADGDEGPFTVVFRGVPLGEALEEVVNLTGIDLVYSSELVGDHQIYCSRRSVSAEAVIQCVLADSGLDYVRSSAGAYILINAPQQPARRARLAGRVLDSESGEPMPYAHVLLVDAGTSTNADGYFAFADVLPGEHRIVATYVGYEPTVVDSVWIEPGADQRLIVELRPAAAQLSPIVVDGLTQRLPSGGLGRIEAADPAVLAAVAPTPDVMRGAAGTIGVSSALPLADLHIQGGHTSEHVTRLDGVPVRDPVALGRYLGAFSPLAIRDVTVHKAGFGAGHGSLISGAIDVRHDVQAVRPGGALQLDPVSVNARVASPIGWPANGGTVLLAYRQSLWGIYDDSGIGELLERANHIDPMITGAWLGENIGADDITTIRQIPDVAFSDAHAAVHLRPDAFSSVQASLFRAGNFVAATHEANVPYLGGQRSLAFRDEYDWTNWAGQVRYSRLLGSRTTLAIRARGSHHASSYIYDYSAEEGRPGDALPPGEPQLSDSGQRLVEGALETEVGISLRPGWDVETGLAADWIDARFHAENALISPFAVDAKELHLSGFLQSRLAVGPRLTLEGGTRMTAIPSSGGVYAEPRAAARYDGDASGLEGYALRLSGGLYRQFVNGFPFPSIGPAALVPELWFWLPVTEGMTPPRAFHAALEGLLLPAPNVLVRAETYLRWESSLLTLDMPFLIDGTSSIISPDAISTPVHGRSFGGGITAQWSAAGSRLAVSYSFEQSRRSSPLEDELRSVSWEEPHRLSVDGRVALGQGFAAEAAGRGVWGRSWGLRRAYYDYLAATAVAPSGLFDRPQEDILPPLLIVDAKLSYRPEVRGVPMRLELGVANLLNRENVVDWSVDGSGPEFDRLPRLLPGRRLSFAIRVDL